MTLVVSNIVAVKIVEVGGRQFDAGTLLFPLAYLIGDVLTEVYGYRRARTVIWIGFLANLIAVAAIQIAIHLPAADFWSANQDGLRDRPRHDVAPLPRIARRIPRR